MPKRFLFRGQWCSMGDIARLTGMTYDCLRHRLVRAGMSVDEATTKPVAPHDRRNPKGRPPRLYWFRGERRSIRAVADLLGVDPSTVRGRIIGDTILEADEAKAIPCERGDNEHLLRFKGTTRNVTEWARALGMPSNTLRSRLDKGWSIERTLTTPVVHPRRFVLARMVEAFRRARNAHAIARLVEAFGSTTNEFNDASTMQRTPSRVGLA